MNFENDHYSNLKWTKTAEEDSEDMSEWRSLEKLPNYVFFK